VTENRNVHPTAVVEPGAVLGAGVEVGPFAYIAAGARVGAGCSIGAHATVYGCVQIGAGCRVHATAVLGDVPQDLGFAGGESAVVIGERCVLREGVTVHRGTKPGTSTVIGDDCFLMAFSHVAHNVVLGPRVIVANGALLAGYVEVGERCFISGNAVIHQFVRIGRLAMLGGGCGISKDVPPFCTMCPTALNEVAGLNVVGMRRAGIGAAERQAVRQAFKLLFRSGLNVSQAVAELRRLYPSGPAAELAEFSAGSKRGICVMGRGDVDEGGEVD
jgi:UDP-N-acetylglucosamine acyltransferase